jgi:signal transduction histidine kinase
VLARHDPVLADERDVLEAAGSAVSLAHDNARLTADLDMSIEELEASRKRLASAADQERRRIEQDLHDGAQTGLIALRIKLGLLEELAAEDPASVALGLADAAKQVDIALAQIRNLAQGIYPTALRDLGIARALSVVARESPITVALHADLRRRFPPDVETAVYFCCVEALQNVAKHCGPGARASVTLADRPDGLEFLIADNGPGFDPATITPTHGITGMRDRLGAVGGTLTITSTPRRGSTLTGRVPVAVL